MDSLGTQLAAISIGISLLVVLTWLALRRLVQRRREQSASQSKRIQSMLGIIKSEAIRIEQGAKRYPLTAPEPYGPLAKSLDHKLRAIRAQHTDQAAGLKRLSAKTLEYPGNPLSLLLFEFWREPRYWQRRFRQLERLHRSAAGLQTEINRAALLLQELGNKRQDAARRARKQQQDIERALQTARELWASGVHGDMLASAINATEKLKAALQEVSPRLCEGTDSPVNEGTGREDVIAAWPVLKKTQRPVQIFLKRFQQWQAQHREIGQALRMLWKEDKKTQVALDAVPAPVDINRLVLQLKQAHNVARRLETEYASTTIEAFPDLTARISQQTEAAQRLTAEAQGIKHSFEILSQRLTANAALLSQIEIRMKQVVLAEKYPIAWEHRQAELGQLCQFQAHIEPITVRRTPEQIEKHLRVATDLNARIKTLSRAVDQARTQRDELIPLLERPELADSPAWSTQAENLDPQISRYNATNWPRENSVSAIPADARDLYARRRKLVPAHVSASIPVSQLALLLDQVGNLLADLEAFQERLERVASRLTALQAMEQKARQELETGRQTAERLIRHLDNADLAFSSTVVTGLKTLQQLRAHGDKLISELETPRSGRIEEKAKRAAAWLDSYRESLEVLSPALQKEIKGTEADLQSAVETLEELAPFHRERAMQEAKQLLQTQRPANLPPPKKTDEDKTARIGLLTNRLDESLREQERLFIALKNLESQIKDRVSPRRKEFEQASQEALEKFDALRQLKKSVEAGWPALACDIRSAEKLLSDARREQREMQKYGPSVRGVLRRLDQLIKLYAGVRSKVLAQEERIRDESEALRELLERIDHRRSELQTYLESPHQDAAVVEAAEKQLEKIDAAIEKARKYRRGKPLSYQEARQILQSIFELAREDWV